MEKKERRNQAGSRSACSVLVDALARPSWWQPLCPFPSLVYRGIEENTSRIIVPYVVWHIYTAKLTHIEEQIGCLGRVRMKKFTCASAYPLPIMSKGFLAAEQLEFFLFLGVDFPLLDKP